jgi:hypothetical protein
MLTSRVVCLIYLQEFIEPTVSSDMLRTTTFLETKLCINGQYVNGKSCQELELKFVFYIIF